MTVKSANRTSRAALVSAVILAVAALRLGRDLLMPFALAVLLSFLLMPLVMRLQRHIGRMAAVVAVTFLTLTAVIAIVWLLMGQVTELIAGLPEYKHTITAKVMAVRNSLEGAFGEVSRTVDRISADMATDPSATPAPKPADTTPSQPARASYVTSLVPLAGPLVAPLGTAAVIAVFVIFMLVYHDDLRDRLLRLIGTDRLNETTQALDEATSRVSRYLRMQSIINASHGVVVAVGLYFIGLPAAPFFGLAAALLRFIPYLGPVLAASMPIGLALAVFDGWTSPLLTMALFIVLELISNNAMEPWLYGSSTGLSPMAVITAAVFWTWLWGGVGLVLSAPLTVCLVVLGRHVARLEFLNILLSDLPALEAKDRLYQRLLAMDDEGALEIAEKHLEGATLEELYDDVLLPALALAERDRHHGDLEDAQAKFILVNMKDIVEQLDGATQAGEAGLNGKPLGAHLPASTPTSVKILCLPARDEADELAGLMLASLLESDGHSVRCASVTQLAAEMVDRVEKEGVQIVCISALPPSSVAHARYLWKRLRSRTEQINIVVGLWTARGKSPHGVERIPEGDRVHAVATLAAGRKLIGELVQATALRGSAEGPGNVPPPR